MTLTQESFTAVTALFERVSGIRLGSAKQPLVAGRLQRLVQEHGGGDLDGYVRQLLAGGDAEAVQQMVDRLTTNETYFFREPRHFEVLAQRLGAHDRRSPFRVWSAASSSGEEAYSVAMVLADRLGDAAWEVVGTDLSSAMVAAARRGLYPLERARQLPERYLKRYCLKGHGAYDGELLVARELRQRAQFLEANLMRPLPALGSFDVIFLRNVLIYFEPAQKDAIVRRVLSLLKPDGLLFTGHAESLANLPLGLRSVQPAVYALA